MSILFTPKKLGAVEIKNRFVHSATYEVMAQETGEVTEGYVKRYKNLARGEVGLIITGHLYVHPLGKGAKYQAGIYSDDMIPGLKRTVETVHGEGGKIFFQLSHAGRQTSAENIGQTPMAPSQTEKDPVYSVKPKEMNEEDIETIIQAFGKAAKRTVEAGADGIQIHAAHGYLINEFLSPFFNRRADLWGGSDENRFRFFEEVFHAVKQNTPTEMPVVVKLNTLDYTPAQGMTPDLAEKYAGWMVALGIDGLEISCGSPVYSFMNMCRGEVPVEEFIQNLPFWKKPLARFMVKKWVGKYDLNEPYNLEAARQIKPVMGETPLLLVGGLREAAQMEKILNENHADFISMCRPFIREPFIVKRIRQGKADAVTCVSCNKCLGFVIADQPLRCGYQA